MNTHNKVAAIALIAVLAAAFGAALAMWSETLRINTYIHTGEVDVAWAGWNCTDTGPDPQAPGFNNTEGKDVASCNVTAERYDNENETIKLNVTITNGYPGYSVNITGYVENTGTIPVKLLNWTITGVNTTALDVHLYIPGDTQLHPGYNHSYILEVTILQNATEYTDYTFEVTLVFAQWNEVP